MTRACIAVLCVAALAPPSAAAATAITVTPATGKRSTTFVVTFKAPHTSRYAVEVAGPRGRCDLARFGPGRRVAKGKTVRIRLDPDLRGWCRGRYLVTVEEYATSAPSDRYV